jgi:hypothetical protein
MDPISKLYLDVINEASLPDSKVKTDLKVGAPFGDSSNEKNTSNFQKGTGTDNVEGLETPEEAPDELTCDVDSTIKKISKESSNPFDALYNKIISEEGSFNFSTEKDNELDSSDLENSFGDDSIGDSDDSDVSEFADSEDDSSEEVTLTLNKELASELIELLQAALGEDSSEDESEEESSEDESEEDESSDDETGNSAFGETDGSSDDNNVSKESFALDDAEELGDALVDVEKLSAGLNNPNNIVVKGNLKPSKKNAETPSTGKHSDGKLKPHNTQTGVSKLTKKNQKVEGGVKEGDFFNNK